MDTPQRIYIAGPMTGIAGMNYPAFYAAEKYLQGAWTYVVNPATLCAEGTSWGECMRTDLAELVRCDAIFLLPGWQQSKGATLEHHVAERIGLTILYAEGAAPVRLDGVGDIDSEAKGSGARYNSGKAKLSLIPFVTLYDEAAVWEYGERKYKAWNWTKGMDWSIPFECAMRHLAKWQAGEDNDEESGLPHLAHAMCNLRMLTLYSKTLPQGDNRPPKENLKG